MLATDDVGLAARSEAEIFSDIERLCSSDGFVHAFAYLIFRNNTIRYSTQVTAQAFDHQYEPGHLVRSELNLLFGLIVKRPVSIARPAPERMQTLLDEAQKLLAELHQSIIELCDAAFWAHLANPEPERDLLSSGLFLRQAMFYDGESAYDFQYIDLSCLKFGNDKDWLEQHKGFAPADALEIATAIIEIQNSRISSINSDFRKIHPDDLDFLNPLSFTLEEVVAKTKLDESRVRRFLAEYSIESATMTNTAYIAPSEFNEVTARPILKRSDGKLVLFSQYGLAEALYTTPYVPSPTVSCFSYFSMCLPCDFLANYQFATNSFTDTEKSHSDPNPKLASLLSEKSTAATESAKTDWLLLSSTGGDP